MGLDVKAVFAIVRRSDGCILCVPRKDTGKLGLPGGKPDPGESAFQALSRELMEETGIQWPASGSIRYTVLPLGNDPILVGLLPDSAWQEPGQSWTPLPRETTPVWLSPEALLGEDGAFPDFNQRALRLLGVLAASSM